MLSTDSSHSCGRADQLRDYVFDELPAGERAGIEKHLRECNDCALELDQLRMTTAALRVIPDQEIPQRIAFVSDKVFEPNWFARFWNSGARLGFASACILAVALVASAWHVADRPQQPATETKTIVQTASVSQAQIDQAVEKAVARVRTEDAAIIQAAMRESRQKAEREYNNQMVALSESFEMLRKKSTYNDASLFRRDEGLGQ
jgi:anti-sigma factor RsiW